MRSIVPIKLRVPEIIDRLAFRPTLIQLLEKGLDRKVALVSAPPGYGKITIMATWVRA